MATQYAAPVTATKVGSYFVQQYYQVFQQQRDFVHQFYNDASTMVRVDGVNSQSASEMVEIHQMITSLNFIGIEIKTINSLGSWNGGVLAVVSGSIKLRDFSGWRKFVQTFFLAPQEKGYFVLNDIFHLLDAEVPDQLPASAVMEQEHDYQPAISTHHPELQGSDYASEEEGGVYMNSANIEGDVPVEEYSFQEHQEEQEPEAERVEEDTPSEDSNPLLQNMTATVQEPAPAIEEPVEEPQKLTYASILCAKGKPAPSVSSRPSFTQSTPPASDWNHASQPSLQQYNVTSVVLDSDADALDKSSPQLEGELKSVYVRNLPPTVTSVDIVQEFRTFGKIKHDGIFLRNRKDADVCYAFVEFEDVQSVQNAIKASPIQLAGKPVYIEERRPNTISTSRGMGRGRGRGGRFGGRTLGRGGDQYATDNNRSKINDFRGI